MDQNSVETNKTKEGSDIESLLGETPFIKEEKDLPDYVNVHLFSEQKAKPAQQIYQCPECLVKYRKIEYLSLHISIHDPDMTCPLCSQMFTCRRKWRLHINNHIKLKMIEDKKDMYNCAFCPKSFNTRKKVTLHTRVHTNERPHKCEICGEGFKQLSALRDHYVTHTKEKRYTCEICGGAYTTSSSLKRHKRKIHDRGRTINCGRCTAKFHNKADFNTHQENMHADIKFRRSCPSCMEMFLTKLAYRTHRELHRDHFPVGYRYLRTYQCKLCGGKVTGMRAYMDHRRMHLCYTDTELKEAGKTRVFQCKLCPVVYKVKQNLYKHMDHHMEKTTTCDVCGSYSTYFGLKSHKRRVHQELSCRVCHKVIVGRPILYYHYRKCHADLAKEYDCKHCGKKFLMKTMLRHHYRSEHQTSAVKNFKCGFCGKRFLTQFHMLTHKKKWHSLRVKYKCSMCDLSFESKKDIAEHKLTHEGQSRTAKRRTRAFRHFRCRVCKKIFRSPRNYKLHMSLKNCVNFLTGKRPVYRCELCDKNFRKADNLARHSQLHSDYEYECPICGKKSKMVESMRRHMKKHHPDVQMFWCDSCEKGFDNLSNYEVHYSSHSMKIEIEESAESGIGVNCSVLKKEPKEEVTESSQ